MSGIPSTRSMFPSDSVAESVSDSPVISQPTSSELPPISSRLSGLRLTSEGGPAAAMAHPSVTPQQEEAAREIQSPLACLPEELQYDIFNRLPVQNLGRLAAVCKDFRQIVPQAWQARNGFRNQAEVNEFFNARYDRSDSFWLRQLHTIVAGKATRGCAPAIAQLLQTPAAARTPQALVEAGLLDQQQLENFPLSEAQKHYLTSEGVILALTQDVKADVQALSRVPDEYLIRDKFGDLEMEPLRILSAIDDQRNDIIENAKKSNLFMNIFHDQSGNTILHHVVWLALLQRAAPSRTANRVRALLDAGANPNLPDRWGVAPLRLAVRSKEAELINLLRNAGASLYGQGWISRTPLHDAAIKGSTQNVGYLTNGIAIVNFDAQDWRGRTALHDAAINEYTEIVKLLLDAGASPNVQDSNGRTPLDHVNSNSVALVAALRQAGGKTSAEWAAQVESSRGSQTQTPETSIAHEENQQKEKGKAKVSEA